MLLPAQKDKLLAEWQGPYTTHKRITDVTYEIIMPEMKEEPHFLCEYASQVGVSDGCLPGVEEATEERVTGEELSTWPSEPDSKPDLSEQQKQELWCAVKKHRKLFQDTSGRTNLTQIRIKMGDAGPIHLPPYRLPKARHQAVQNEVQQLLRAK